jgi:hypothetical protein
MPSGDVFDLSDSLFVLSLKNNISSVSSMINLHCVVEKYAHKVIIRDWTHVVSKGVQVGGIYPQQ